MKALIHYTALFISAILLLVTGCDDLDNTPPAVIRTIPANRAADVQLNTSIEVKFNEVIDPGSIDGAIEIWPAINGVVTRDEKGRSLIFFPQQNLIPGTEYMVTVSGVRDSMDNEMKAYAFSFTSGEEDNIPPRVVETTPTADEEDVLEDTKNITIKFSETLDRTKTHSAFHIRGSMSGEKEIWKARWLDSVTYQLSFRPKLENEEEVVVKLDKSCIADPLGNEMSEDYVFSFTIEGINPVGRPRNYSQRLLSYSIWQGTSGEWHIRWDTNWVQGAPPIYQTSPSQPTPKPNPNPPPKRRPSHPDQHYFSGTIVSDGIFTAELDPYSFSDNDLIQMEVRENLVKVTADEVIVERNEANVVMVKADEIITDGELGDMVSVTEDVMMIEGDIVAITGNVVTVEGSVLTVRGDAITVKGNAGSIIAAEGKVLSVAGNVVILEGEVKSLTGSALVIEGDVIVVQGSRIWFAGSTGIDDSGDGFDFRSDGLLLTFDIKIDNEYMKSNVYIGEKGKHPRDIPFDLKSRYRYSGINSTY
jgi:hypothetical protein